MKCGKMLRNVRLLKKMSAVDVAKKLNLTQASISRYEHNLQEPPIETLIKLADLYGVSLDYLVRGEDSGITITIEEYLILMKVKDILENLENRYEKLNKSINIQADNNSGTIIVGNHNNIDNELKD